MTQLFRAAALFVVPGIAGARGANAAPSTRTRSARAASLLALAALAGCADAVTDPSGMAPAPRMATSAAEFEAQYSIPVPANTLHGNTVPWTNTGITVPRAGKYRIRVQGFVTATQHPLFPGPCPAVAPTQFAGNWGPMGRPELGTHLRVAVYKEAAVDWGFPVRVIDAQTVETEQELEANTQIWAARQGLGLELRCSAHPDPVPVFALTGAQTVTVTEISEPKLECKGPSGENPIQRGRSVRCAITPDKAYKVVSRRATGERFTNAARPDSSHAAETPYVWQGTAVADTRVTMVLELTKDDGSTEQKTYEASFQVQARDWPKLRLNDPSVSIGLRDMAGFPNRMNAGLGNALTEMNLDILNAHPVARPNGGPNAGLMYLAQPWPAVDFSIVLHPGLYGGPTAPAAARRWHEDQNGRGGGTCTQAVFAVLEPAVRRHEGVTKQPNSHWGVANDFFQNSETEQRVEKVYRQTEDAGEVRLAAFNEWRGDVEGPLLARQRAFDAVDTPALFASLGCTVDINRNDP
ncbi:MAG TPA: hypothetical protein VF705_09275 [Longimicrobium sp.]|jgi:hypothetical protein